jgi:hypothetical protein
VDEKLSASYGRVAWTLSCMLVWSRNALVNENKKIQRNRGLTRLVLESSQKFFFFLFFFSKLTVDVNHQNHLQNDQKHQGEWSGIVIEEVEVENAGPRCHNQSHAKKRETNSNHKIALMLSQRRALIVERSNHDLG